MEKSIMLESKAEGKIILQIMEALEYLGFKINPN